MHRLAAALVLVWLVVTLTFVLVRLAPGDAAAILVPPTATPEDAARLRNELALDAPIAVQYAKWMGALLRGDLGESFAQRRPVASVLREALPVSLGLGLASLVLTFVVGVAIGTLQAARRGTAVDPALTFLTTAIYAAPSFWLALSLIAVFTYGATVWGFPAALRLPAFGIRDPGGTETGWAAIADIVRHAVLPVTVLAAVGAAGIARYARSTVADLAGAEWVRTARAKGLPEWSVVGKHALRTALSPFLTIAGLSLGGLLGGSVIVESVLGWQGIGALMVSAVRGRDVPVVMAVVLVASAAVWLGNAMAELLQFANDARIRTGER